MTSTNPFMTTNVQQAVAAAQRAYNKLLEELQISDWSNQKQAWLSRQKQACQQQVKTATETASKLARTGNIDGAAEQLAAQLITWARCRAYEDLLFAKGEYLDPENPETILSIQDALQQECANQLGALLIALEEGKQHAAREKTNDQQSALKEVYEQALAGAKGLQTETIELIKEQRASLKEANEQAIAGAKATQEGAKQLMEVVVKTAEDTNQSRQDKAEQELPEKEEERWERRERKKWKWMWINRLIWLVVILVIILLLPVLGHHLVQMLLP